MKNILSLPAIVGALPITLTNGTTADATQVMADLNWIVNQVNANAVPLANAALKDANNNFTAVQSGLAATDRTNFPVTSQVQDGVFNTLSSTLGTNTITARVAGMTISGYANGAVFTFIPTQTNTGSPTLNIDGVGARPIIGNGSSILAGSLRALIPAMVRYQDPAFQLMSPQPLLPAFSAVKSAPTANATGNSAAYAFICDSEVYDQGGNYNAGTGVFTAPTSGKYRFTFACTVSNLSALATRYQLLLFANDRIWQPVWVGPDQAVSTLIGLSATVDLYMDAGDTAIPKVVVGGMAADTCTVEGDVSNVQTYFSGYKIDAAP